MKVGKEKVEASLKDAQMELDKNRETLKNQTEQTEKLSKEVREEGREREGRGVREGQGMHPHGSVSPHQRGPLFSAGGTEGGAGEKCTGESVRGGTVQDGGGCSLAKT